MINDTVNMRLKILNEKGLHARAAAKFVELVDTFDVSLVVKKSEMQANKEIFHLALFHLANPTSLREIHHYFQRFFVDVYLIPYNLLKYFFFFFLIVFFVAFR